MLAFGLVVAVAAILVVREAGRIARDPPPALFDPDDAYDYVVEELDDLVAATLTPGDVRRILDFELEYLRQRGITGNGSHEGPLAPVVFGGPDTIAYILSGRPSHGRGLPPRAGARRGRDAARYLRAIGAVGPPDLNAGDHRRIAVGVTVGVLQVWLPGKGGGPRMHDRYGTLEVRGR